MVDEVTKDMARAEIIDALMACLEPETELRPDELTIQDWIATTGRCYKTSREDLATLVAMGKATVRANVFDARIGARVNAYRMVE